jgi:hypothetical protein
MPVGQMPDNHMPDSQMQYKQMPFKQMPVNQMNVKKCPSTTFMLAKCLLITSSYQQGSQKA